MAPPPAPRPILRALPKSPIFRHVASGSSSRLAGLMSRCTTRLQCKWSMPSSSCSESSCARGSLKAPWASTWSPTVPPPQSSIQRQAPRRPWKNASARTIPLWLRLRTSLYSSCRPLSCSCSEERMRLAANCLPSLRRVTFCTNAIEPAPNSSPTSKPQSSMLLSLRHEGERGSSSGQLPQVLRSLSDGVGEPGSQPKPSGNTSFSALRRDTCTCSCAEPRRAQRANGGDSAAAPGRALSDNGGTTGTPRRAVSDVATASPAGAGFTS
mmetsp:Transcript_66587/g.184387  ORF Transcript_66587/g.184387 Transcript_66587/m.184387 type:complete len:268 (+) Transcript_66587:606-1409(+)